MSSKVEKKKTKERKPRETSEAQQEAIKLRRDKVFELTLKGLTQPRVAEVLEVSQKTIARDQEVIRDDLVAELKEIKKAFNPEEFWARMYRELMIQKKDMYMALTESKGDRTMVIRALREINEDIEKCLAKVGVNTQTEDAKEHITSTLKVIMEYADNDID